MTDRAERTPEPGNPERRIAGLEAEVARLTAAQAKERSWEGAAHEYEEQARFAQETADARGANLRAVIANLTDALDAIAQGWPMVTKEDRWITVENPKYLPDDGTDPQLVIDTWDVRERSKP
jgi:hypothetical protein